MSKLSAVLCKIGAEYVKNINSGSGATKDCFIENFWPIGKQLWQELLDAGWVYEDENSRMRLTLEGCQSIRPTGDSNA